MTATSDVMPTAGVPPVPPGPGVQPPFVAPPTDGSRRRRWVAGGLAAAAVLVLCLGGAGGLGALVVLATRVINDEAQTSVENYLTALHDEDYDQAYNLLCDREQERLTREQFARQASADAGVESFTVNEVTQRTDDILVRVTVRYDDGTADTISYRVVPDDQTSAMEVCGEG